MDYDKKILSLEKRIKFIKDHIKETEGESHNLTQILGETEEELGVFKKARTLDYIEERLSEDVEWFNDMESMRKRNEWEKELKEHILDWIKGNSE